jgi:hypothetical protein
VFLLYSELVMGESWNSYNTECNYTGIPHLVLLIGSRKTEH